MPLTRPPLSFLNSNSTVFNDPLLVLHQGSGSADSDVGFVFNRANGLVANVAVYWSETDDTFYTAYTNSGGATDANLVPTSYAPFTVGTINANNAVVTGNLTVSGTTTTINTTNSTISDSLIELNSGAGSNANDLGFIFERGSTGDNAAFIWDESADTFVLGTTTATGASTGDLTITNGDLQVDTIKNREQRYTTSNMMKFNQVYTGAATGSYFTQNEYQKIVTIVPSDASQNYQVSGRILCQTASSIQTINFIAGLRSNTLPDLDWSITYTEQHNGTAHFKPQLWVKETTTAGFIFAIQKISSGNLYGTVTVDLDVIPRNSTQLDNVTVNTTQDSEQTSIDAGYTANDMTLVQSISGSTIEFSNAYTFPTSDGSANQVLTTNGSGTLSFADASGGDDVTVTANNSTDETTFLTFVDGATGSQGLETDTGLTYNPSTNTLTTSVFSGTATTAQYADLAENYVADFQYEPGTVLIFGGGKEVTQSRSPGNNKIAGVVSTAPGVLMNRDCEGEFVVALAFTGRVPTKVKGTINKGDMMVSSNIEGVAVASDNPQIGTVIGKALENYDSEEVGVIEVVVGRL